MTKCVRLGSGGVCAHSAAWASTPRKDQFFVVQVDLMSNLDNVLSPGWLQIVVAFLVAVDHHARRRRGRAPRQARAARCASCRASACLMLQAADPSRHCRPAARWVEGKLVTEVTLCAARAAACCGLVDLGDEFIQWYIECYAVVALGGPSRFNPLARITPLTEKSVSFLKEPPLRSAARTLTHLA